MPGICSLIRLKNSKKTYHGTVFSKHHNWTNAKSWRYESVSAVGSIFNFFLIEAYTTCDWALDCFKVLLYSIVKIQYTICIIDLVVIELFNHQDITQINTLVLFKLPRIYSLKPKCWESVSKNWARIKWSFKNSLNLKFSCFYKAK